MTKRSLSLLLAVVCLAAAAHAEETPVRVTRASGPITIDGDLSDPAWQTAARFDEWFETNPGDNVPPKEKNVGWLTYDDHFFYAAFRFDDSTPSQIRAPFGDHDNVNGSTDDYGGVIIDSRNDGKTAILFLVNPHNIQYDADTDDNTGEDNSPDHFWDSATKITDKGWQLEIRIPFSSLRYKSAEVQTWGVMLYRNFPRDRRYQYFSHRIPRDTSCFVCNYNKITGLEGLPSGGHIVAAPYVTAKLEGAPRNDVLGADIVTRPPSADEGLDVKWTPNAYTAIDATVNPDFSQIESDVAAISTNERFAIFFPEKRPFFLEDVNIFNTLVQAVSTRTITSPRWGLRATGKEGDHGAYTLLVAQDRGGGLTILPSPLGSDFAEQDFPSLAVIGRTRHDFGTSYVSFLGTTREIEGGAHNRVLGPDFVWRIGDHHTITGQLLLSDSRTPERPDLASEWDGRKLRSYAGQLRWAFSTAKNDLFTEVKDYGDDFRADNGFVPQVGFRSGYVEYGHTFRPKGFFSRIRTFGITEYDTLQDGSQLYRLISGGFGADGSHRSFLRFRLANENYLNNGHILQQNRLYYSVQFAVNRVLSFVTFGGWVGDAVDFANDRLGRGADIATTGTIRPNDHLEMRLTNDIRWIDVHGGRLFTSQVERIKTTYTFDAKRFLRLVVQNTRTNRNQGLYTSGVDHHSGALATQALFAYKLNWQTVLFFGVGDLREVTADQGDFETSARQVFLKLSYAFQR